MPLQKFLPNEVIREADELGEVFLVYTNCTVLISINFRNKLELRKWHTLPSVEMTDIHVDGAAGKGNCFYTNVSKDLWMASHPRVSSKKLTKTFFVVFHWLAELSSPLFWTRHTKSIIFFLNKWSHFWNTL